jgi:hypothetical protein
MINMEKAEKLFLELLEKGKTDRATLCALKIAAVRSQAFELASSLREMELKNFPETVQEKEAIEIGVNTALVLSMVGIKVQRREAWIIQQSIKQASKRKGKFSTENANNIRLLAHTYFPYEDKN